MMSEKNRETVMEEVTSQEEKDSEQLTRIGKKPVLRRNFSFLAILGFSCTILVTWEGALVLFAQGLQNGGPAGIIYGFFFVWVGNISVFSALSELASMAPTSGGQYHWVAMLAPRSCAKFLSYITGWLMVAGWQGTLSSALMLGGGMLQSLIVLGDFDYKPEGYRVTLFFWALMVPCLLVNVWKNKVLARFEAGILFLHLLGFIGILVTVVTLAPHSSAKFVFTTFVNKGNWPNQGLSFFVGLVGNVYAFAGVDGAFHLSEEVYNPSVAIPRTTMLSLMINGTLGFAMMIAVLFCMGDPEKVINSRFGFPFMDIFYNATGSASAAIGLTMIIFIMGSTCTIGQFASTSRVFWSVARDRGLPGWTTLSKVHPTTKVPLWAMACTSVIALLLSLINLGSETAFNNVISISISGMYSSYLLAAALLLYRRCTGGFAMPEITAMPALENTTGAKLTWGPWHIPGIWGIINNAFACVYLIIVWLFAFFPPAIPITAANMNYDVLVTGGVTIFSIVYYIVWAKRNYKGPIIEVDNDIRQDGE